MRLTDEAQGTPTHWPNGRARGVQRLSYKHEQMVNLLIANPYLTREQIAEHFGCSAGWVSQIIASNAFQARLAERRAELTDPVLLASVEARFKGLVLRSLEIIFDKLDRPVEQIPDQLVLRALELSLRALDYGRGEPQPPVAPANVQLHLESLSDNLTRLLQRKKAEAGQTIDAAGQPTRQN
jgi:hypothetical protein